MAAQTGAETALYTFSLNTSRFRNLLVLSEKVYKAVSAPVWAAMLGISLAYLGYSVYKGQKNYKEMWEVKPLWN